MGHRAWWECAWRECERESLLVHELPGWPGSLSPALGLFQMKTGPFAEHSNQLWNISAVPSWSKVNQGLIRMYKAEVSAVGRGRLLCPHTSSLPLHHGSALLLLLGVGPPSQPVAISC